MNVSGRIGSWMHHLDLLRIITMTYIAIKERPPLTAINDEPFPGTMAGENPTPMKKAKHICLTNRMPLGISSDPEADIIRSLDDPDVLTVIRGMMKAELVAPFTGGSFGLDEPAINAVVKKMKAGGLICSRTVQHEDGIHHHYYLNTGRFRTLLDFLAEVVEESERMKSSFSE